MQTASPGGSPHAQHSGEPPRQQARQRQPPEQPDGAGSEGAASMDGGASSVSGAAATKEGELERTSAQLRAVALFDDQVQAGRGRAGPGLLYKLWAWASVCGGRPARKRVSVRGRPCIGGSAQHAARRQQPGAGPQPPWCSQRPTPCPPGRPPHPAQPPSPPTQSQTASRRYDRHGHVLPGGGSGHEAWYRRRRLVIEAGATAVGLVFILAGLLLQLLMKEVRGCGCGDLCTRAWRAGTGNEGAAGTGNEGAAGAGGGRGAGS